MKAAPKWIEFTSVPVATKTKAWDVAPTGQPTETLGRIKWYGAWRKYCFFPHNGTISSYTVFEWQCLRDIAQFCEDQTKSHKAEKAKV